MDTRFKPSGYNSLSPYIISSDAVKLAALVSKIFDASIERQFDLPNGKIMHAEIKLDDSILMIADANENYPPNQSILHVYVKNAGQTFDLAIGLGCTIVEAINRREGDPDIRGTFKDFDGNMWSVGTQQ
ncbi:MAG: VOC family protein [Chitinophagaceae bacterium]|nr:MAG: VOC family protein [Chitinophagaceae bacterium]